MLCEIPCISVEMSYVSVGMSGMACGMFYVLCWMSCMLYRMCYLHGRSYVVYCCHIYYLENLMLYVRYLN